ncbi:MAG: AAA family ATPase [Oscillospiraceae bacterium]|jgi:DNA polymerase-3 subunit delta'|nr:AAA family ATPase [Oscillospiraceae bacterium]
MKFKDFLGNKFLKNEFLKIFSTGNFPHSIVFYGEEGAGKSTFAQIVASAVVCESCFERPCGVCGSCKKASLGSHPDITCVENKNHTESVGVDEIRKIKKEVCILPNEARHKVYIFENADKLTKQAQSAILKTLEEPPEFVVFIFICISIKSLLATFVSRCQVYFVSPVNENLSFKFLKEHKPDSTSNILKITDNFYSAAKKNDSFEKDSILHKLDFFVFNTIKSIVEKNEWELMTLLNEVSKNLNLFEKTLDAIAFLLKKKLIFCEVFGVYFEAQNSKTFQLLEGFDFLKVKNLLNIVKFARELKKQNVKTDLLTTYVCTKISSCVF